MFAINNVQAQAGPDLEELQTEALGFLSIAGETRLRLLPSPWPVDALPNPTSSLMSIASKQGLLAAAGPDTLIIASTSAVRDAFTQDGPVENNIKNFTPQLKISIPRISQVAFSTDESNLIICADEGGGLAVYDVQALKQGHTAFAFQISTNGVSVRSIVPNPSEENAHIVALVLAKGQLVLANLKERQLISASNGPILREGVSSVSWSVKGKQLVAGLGNGTAVQMTPDGVVKAEIPRPPQLDGDQHVSAIVWHNNDSFLLIYTPSNFEMDHAPDSTYILTSRVPKTSNFTFQRMADPCPPFGMNRSPPHHFIMRLREFPPSLTDVLFLASTAAGDIGLITCSQKPLSNDAAAVQAATNSTYMTTGLAVDARRAQLPVNEEMTDTSPIGVAIDLSSSGKVKRPIPGEEIEESATPLPNLMVLNNEGILSSWWFVYSDSVRQGTAFPGLIAAAGQQQQQQNQSSMMPNQTQSGFSGFANTNANGFAKPTAPAFGVSGGPAFGSTTMSSSKLPIWGSKSTTAPAFGQSAFGTSASNTGSATNSSQFGPSTTSSSIPKFGAPSFGAATSMANNAHGAAPSVGSSFGAKQPVFGSASAIGTAGDFGAATQISKASESASSASNTSSGFSAFANKPSGFGNLGASNTSAISGFSSLGQSSPAQASIFGAGGKIGSNSTTNLGAPSNLGSGKLWGASSDSNSAGTGLFGRTATPNQEKDDDMMDETTPAASGPPSAKFKPVENQQSLFGGGFSLNSSFKTGATAEPELSKPDGNNFMGSGFGQALQSTSNNETPSTPIKQEPVTTPKLEEPSTTPASVAPQAVKPATSLFGSGVNSHTPLFLPPSKAAETTSLSTNPAKEVNEPAPLPPSPKLSSHDVIPEPAPLPPSPTLAVSPKEDLSPAGSPPVDLGAPGGSPLSSTHSITSEEGLDNDAPLPPDFLSDSPSSLQIEKGKATEGPPLPSKIPVPTGDKSGPSTDNKPAPKWSFPKFTAPTESSGKLTFPEASLQPQTNSIKPPTFFQPPAATPGSPRSPSPVRNQSTLGLPSPVRSAPQSFLSTSNSTPSLKPTTRIAVAPPSPLSRQLSTSTSRAEPEPDASYLSDDEDERIRAELAEPVNPTKRLEPFIAYQDYVDKVVGQGVSAQIEKVYRDINSMIDTLGLNARSLNAFIMGHSEMFADGGREKEHLENEDDWCLIEIEDLSIVQKDILTRLDAERPQDVKPKIAELQALQKELILLRTRSSGIPGILHERKKPEDSSSSRFASVLSPEQSAVLGDLRKQFTHLQRRLVEAEDAASLLAAKLAAREVGPGAGRAVPTVEAVVNTIAKMTRMAEQKRGDLDVIEQQMRRLRFRPTAASYDDLDLSLGALSLGAIDNNAGEDSLFMTPPSSRAVRTPGVYQLTYEDDSPSPSPSPARERGFRPSLTASARARARQEETRVNISEEDIDAFKARRERRKKVLNVLKAKITERDAANKQAE